jgi:hypothetical protein
VTKKEKLKSRVKLRSFQGFPNDRQTPHPDRARLAAWPLAPPAADLPLFALV